MNKNKDVLHVLILVLILISLSLSLSLLFHDFYIGVLSTISIILLFL